MKSPRRKRPQRREIGPTAGRDLAAVAAKVSYVGSPEHKDTPSFAGIPRPRPDATLCDPSFSQRQDDITTWLREAVVSGKVSGTWEGEFPRYAWAEVEGRCYEARLVNQGQGQYKAYALTDPERPNGL